MSANFFFDATGAFKKIEETKKVLQVDMEKVLGVAMSNAATEIVIRTEAGRDESGKPFKAYAKSTLKNKGSSRVNLEDTGHMMGNIKSSVSKIAGGLLGKIFFDSGAGAKARWNTDGDSKRNRPPRPFFSLSKKQLDRIEKAIKEAINGRR